MDTVGQRKYSLSEMLDVCEGLTFEDVKIAIRMYRIFKLQQQGVTDSIMTNILNRLDKLERGVS